MSSTPTRRDVLTGLASTVAAATMPTLASAASEVPNIERFYKEVPKTTFENTFGDSLSPVNVPDEATLRAVLTEKAALYEENYIKAAKEFVDTEFTDKASAQSFLDELLKTRPRRTSDNLLSAVINDVEGYIDDGKEPTNPLFGSIAKLAEEKIISPEVAELYIFGARNITHDYERTAGIAAAVELKAFNESLKAVIQPVIDSKLAKPAPAGSVPKFD